MPFALKLSDAGLDLTSLIGECFAMDELGMIPAMRKQKGFDGHLADGGRVQVKCKGPNKTGAIPVESEFFPDVGGYDFDVFLGVQLMTNYRVWRYVLLPVDQCKHYITSQKQASFNGTTKEHCLRLDTVTYRGLWKIVSPSP
jgi:hypothetical protein